MPLRIRCPHCQVIAVVPDELAGEERLCDACQTRYTVPLPTRAVGGTPSAGPDVAGRCPRCRTAVAPGTTHCPRCKTEIATGQRLALARRAQSWSIRTWTGLALALLVVGAGAWIGIGAYLARQRAERTPPAAFTPTPRIEIPPAPIAARLLAARSGAERRAARMELEALLPAAGPAIAAELARTLESDAAGAARANQLAAIELLSKSSGDAARRVLKQAAAAPALHDEAIRSLGLLGDASVLPETAALWQGHLRRATFLARCAALAGTAGRPGVNAAVQRAERATDRYAEALRRLGQPAVDALAEDAWATWHWLGQVRDERYAAALFAVAMPAPDESLDVRTAVTVNVRAARDALLATANAAPPAASAAAARVLKQCAPQYESARERMVAKLAGLLASSAPMDQQRIVWTLAVLTGRPFGAVTATDSPADVDRSAVLAALEWSAESRLIPRVPSRALAGEYPARPPLVRRVYTARRQMEAAFLAGLRGGWPEARGAVEAWVASPLPVTPRLAALLSPGQRQVHLPALAGAMAIAAARADRESRRALELWCAAVEQPAWVRNLARTALAAIDAQHGHANPWPVGLELDGLAALDASEPGWAVFGRVLLAGGERLLARLRDATPTALPPAIRDKLLRAAEQALRTRGDAPLR